MDKLEQLSKIKEFREKAESLNNRGLGELLTEMERVFKIPSLRDDKFEKENEKVTELYREIAKKRIV